MRTEGHALDPARTTETDEPTSRVRELLAAHLPALVALRRDVHAHPELSRCEHRTTDLLVRTLRGAGLEPRLLPGTGLLCDVGEGAPRVAVRADLDALPLQESTGLPFSSTVAGVAHACGHDVHTAAVLGAGLVLADLHAAGALPGAVRLVFQPAEEATPGGATDVVAAGGLDGIERIFGIHCDPHLEVGRVGLVVGPLTAAFDKLKVVLSGPGGHTSRPHLTADLVFALAKVITETPAVLSRRLDPRAGASMVWGQVEAGGAANAIPPHGVARGTLRCLDVDAWRRAGDIMTAAIGEIVAPYGVDAHVDHERGVPPVVNDAGAIEAFDAAARAVVGPDAVASTDQSLGGEDFAWYLQHTRGAMARLGVRAEESAPTDLHRGDFDPDERAIAIGAALLAGAALQPLEPANL